MTDVVTSCREYQGTRHQAGYGMRHGKPMYRFGTPYVHRQVWIMANGPIPDGMVVMHSCDNPSCFRLDHLSLGTNAENHADMVSKGRHFIPEPRRIGTHCKHGHEFTPENTKTNDKGHKSCRECQRLSNLRCYREGGGREKQRERRQRRKGEGGQ